MQYPGDVQNAFKLAQQEIYSSFGHVTRIGRKSLSKYGRNVSVGTSESDITWNGGTEVHTFDNTITHVSSANAADVGNVIYLEHMTISGSVFTFGTQTVTLNGQNKVPLDVPCAECTRMRGVTAGEVYVYEDTALTAGKPTDTTKIHNTLVPSARSSLKTATAVAGTNYFVMTSAYAAMGKASGSAAAEIRMKMVNLGDLYLGNEEFTAFVTSITLSAPLNMEATEFQIVKPNSLVAMTAAASGGTLDIMGRFSGFFADIVDPDVSPKEYERILKTLRT